jgi:hypothetical protein
MWAAAAAEGFSGQARLGSVDEMFAAYYDYGRKFIEPDRVLEQINKP